MEGTIEKAPDHNLSMERALEIASTCRGLELAHSWGIVERDLKPGNVQGGSSPLHLPPWAVG